MEISSKLSGYYFLYKMVFDREGALFVMIFCIEQSLLRTFCSNLIIKPEASDQDSLIIALVVLAFSNGNGG